MGQMIGKDLIGYTILREIGEGGMGKVYLAENATIGQQVAIKVLDPVLVRNPELRERFNQEARIQVALQHNNIVRIFNAQSSDELSFLVMEYIDGESLDKVLRRRGKLSADEAIKIMRQVLDAVGYAHSKGIVHRDLKPSNILVCADGTAKVTDFGIAKVLGDTKLTRTGTSMGSPDYMSPEQVLGKKDIDHRTDIYSLGATLFEMLTGRPPFVIENGNSTDSDFLIKQAHVQNTPVGPNSFSHDVSDHLSSIVLSALSKDPNDRIQSCDKFFELLFDSNELFDDKVDLNKSPSKSESVSFRYKKLLKILIITVFSALFFGIYFLRQFTSDSKTILTLNCYVGSSASCYKAAEIAHEEVKNPKSKEEARIFYQKACKLDSPEGCWMLGVMYSEGIGGPKDESEAKALYTKGCERGSLNTCSLLGGMLERGEAGAADLAEAERLYEKVCIEREGNDISCIKRSNLQRRHERTAHFESCENGDAYSCFKLANMYAFGHGGPVEQTAARRFFSKACDGGYLVACKYRSW